MYRNICWLREGMVTFLGCPCGLPGSGASSRSLPSPGLTQPALGSAHSGSFLRACPPAPVIPLLRIKLSWLRSIAHCKVNLLECWSIRMSTSITERGSTIEWLWRMWCLKKRWRCSQRQTVHFPVLKSLAVLLWERDLKLVAFLTSLSSPAPCLACYIFSRSCNKSHSQSGAAQGHKSM